MKKFASERGAVAVELALVIPLLATLMFGIISAGRYYNTQVSLSHAAREAARVVALGGSAADAELRVSATVGGLSSVSVSVPAVCPATPTSPPSDASVTASVPFTFNIPFVPIPSTTISSTGVMRCGG